MSRHSIASRFIELVHAEREYQRKKWTDPHDDTHNGMEWGGLLARYVGRVVENALNYQPDLYKRSLVALAAVAMAAWEADFRRTESFLREEKDTAPAEASP